MTLLLLLTAIMVTQACYGPLSPERRRASASAAAASGGSVRISGNAVFHVGVSGADNAVGGDVAVTISATIETDGTVHGWVTTPALGSGPVDKITHMPVNRIWCVQYPIVAGFYESTGDRSDLLMTLWISDIGDGAHSSDLVGLIGRGGAMTYEPCDRFQGRMFEVDQGDFKVSNGS